MNKIERVKMVKAMEFIMRNVNDESIFEYWLVDGVADGDIEYGDLSAENVDETLEFYIRPGNFRELMGTFVYYMAKAHKSGGLYCDEVTSIQ